MTISQSSNQYPPFVSSTYRKAVRVPSHSDTHGHENVRSQLCCVCSGARASPARSSHELRYARVPPAVATAASSPGHARPRPSAR